MKKLCSTVMILTVVAVASFSASESAQARPQYHKAMVLQYPKAEAVLEEQKCGGCHGGEKGKDKKVLNGYGKALLEALELKTTGSGDKVRVVPERSVDKVRAALEKIEEKKETDDAKTYGELLKAGELPPPAPEAEE